MREMLIFSVIGGTVYMVLYVLESLWNFVVMTPPRVHAEQEALISQLRHENETLNPQISVVEQRKRQMVREMLADLGTASVPVLQTILDHGEITYISLARMRLQEHVYQIVLKAEQLNLVHKRAFDDKNAILTINPDLKSALAFVLDENGAA